MANPKRILFASKARRGKNRVLIHRSTNQFKDFFRLVKESHARVSSKQEQPKELAAVN